MATLTSALRPGRQSYTRRVPNQYDTQPARTDWNAFRNPPEKEAAEKLLPKVASMLDKLAKKNIIHKNKAGNLKSSLQVHVNGL